MSFTEIIEANNIKWTLEESSGLEENSRVSYGDLLGNVILPIPLETQMLTHGQNIALLFVS